MIGIEQVLSAIPFTAIAMLLVLMAIRYDLWVDLIEIYSHYFQVSTPVLLIGGFCTIFIMMLLGSLLWGLLLKYFEYCEDEKKKQEVLAREREILILLFNKMNGKSWKDQTHWCSKQPLYKWKGVHLNPNTKRVNKLILAEFRLEGEIPEEIGELTELIEIDFRLNKITGPIPESFLKLRKLEGLYLYDNNMEGEIPKEIAHFPRLSGIYLFNNQFTNSKEMAVYYKEKLPEETYVFI